MIGNAINSTLELFTLIMLACLMTALLWVRRGSKRDKIFIAVVCFHAISTLGDLLAWCFTGKSDMLASVLTRLGNTLTYTFIPIASVAFLTLVFAYASRGKKLKTAFGKVLLWIIFIISAVMIGILISNPQTGLLFRIDENNCFYWGTASSFLPDGAVLLQFILFVFLLAAELHGQNDARIRLPLLCCVIPMAAIVFEIFDVGLMLLYPTLATSLLLLYFGRQHEIEEQLFRQKLELSDSRTKLLLAQIRPHFIFNSLLAIQQLCKEDPQKAERAVGDFSEYLRGNLDAMTNEGLIPFEKELEHIRCYLALETVDPARNIKAEYNLETTDFCIPPLTVQPLVENAVRHGFKTPLGGGINHLHK